MRRRLQAAAGRRPAATVCLGAVLLALTASSVTATDRARPSWEGLSPLQQAQQVHSTTSRARLRAWLTAHPGQLYVFGDSYTEGIGASRPAAGYAQVMADILDVPTVVDGIGGTGFIATGGAGLDFGDRLSERVGPAPLVSMLVVQVGLNDARLHPSPFVERAAAEEFLRTAARAFPGALVVLVGPPAVSSIPAGDIATVDRSLRAAAADLGVPFISPLTAGWDIGVDSADGLHPGDAGHLALAVLLVSALASIVA